MTSASLTFPVFAFPAVASACTGGPDLPAPRELLSWWLAIALLTWVQVRHGAFLPLPDPAWRGVVALALSVTIVSSVAGRSALEAVLLLVCAGAVAIVGGSVALVPLASAAAALALTHPHDGIRARRPRNGWRGAIGPCALAVLSLAAWSPSLLANEWLVDRAAQVCTAMFAAGVVVLSWIHARHCQGAGGSPYAGPVCAVAILAGAGCGLATTDLKHTVAMLLILATWLPLLLAAHQPAGNPTTWWFRRGAITLSACALGCWLSVTVVTL